MKAFHKSNLNYLQLACILGCALGVPAMTIGGQLVKKYGSGAAISSICVGNLILWCIGMGVITMAESTNQAIQNVKSYLGRYTGLFSAALWMVTFLFWYAIQIQGVSFIVNDFVLDSKGLSIGVSVGLLVAFLSYWNIKIIKKICVVFLPLLVSLMLYALMTSSDLALPVDWGFSFEGIVAAIVVWLPFTVNLPTLMRHAISRADAVLAISIKTGLLVFFELATVFLNVDTSSDFVRKLMFVSSETGIVIALFFVIASYICVNLLNIYFAYAGWETVFPKFQSKWRYCCVGILGTFLFYILQLFESNFQFKNTLVVAEMILTGFFVNLGFVLMIDFLLHRFIKGSLRPYQRVMSTICWGSGCIVTVYTALCSNLSSANVYSMGVLASCVFFLVALFISVSISSLKQVLKEI